MLTKAAVLHEIGADWQVEEIELADPQAGEVQVRLAASGLCHSDEHLVTGATPVPWPALGGHEGAGVVTGVGDGVRGLAAGGPVVLAFLPACGTCRPCATGPQNLCDRGAELRASQTVPRATTAAGEPLMRMCMLGTFAPYVTVDEASVIKIEPDIPLELAALLGCGVSTGWGSATAIGGTRPGDTVVVIGVGGVGMIQEALALTAKGGQVVVTAMGHYADRDVSLNLFELTLLQKRVQGAIFGGVSPRHQIPLLLEAYRSGRLKLAELVTPYRLEDINQGYQDMRDGKNLRGVIRYADADY